MSDDGEDAFDWRRMALWTVLKVFRSEKSKFSRKARSWSKEVLFDGVVDHAMSKSMLGQILEDQGHGMAMGRQRI